MTGNIVRSDDLRNENRRRVLNCLRTNGPTSPARLADETGLSAASISSLNSQMVDQGIVVSSRQRLVNTGRGRPQSLIQLKPSAADVITLNISIDLVQVRRINYAGDLLHESSHHIDTRSMGKFALLDFLCDTVERVISIDIGNPVQRIGVAFQGVIKNITGTLAWSPIIQHENVNLGHVLQSRFEIPISVNNDCRLISEALSRKSNDILGNSFATVLFSHGVGLGLYIDGKPFSGIHSSALELGHLRFERDGALCRCGRKGCIEAYAANYGIERLATGQSIHEDPSGRVDPDILEKLCEAGASGDIPAVQAFAIAGAAVGEGLSTIFTLLDSMPVALVGRSNEGFELMRKGLNSVFENQGQHQSSVSIDNLLHCFDDAEPLLQEGLSHNTLAFVDTHFAYINQAASAASTTTP